VPEAKHLQELSDNLFDAGSGTQIIVDSREEVLHCLLNDNPLFEVESRHLEIGDVVISDTVIERKTGEDLLRSLEDGRFFRQLLLMKRVYRKRLLLVEGEIPRTLTLNVIEGVFVRV
jgi:ERCC4-type nuclease